MGIIYKDTVQLCEEKFFEPKLLNSDYFKKLRDGYYRSRELGGGNPFRNYLNILGALDKIKSYCPEHARSFVKRLLPAAGDWNACEAVCSEILVYTYYIPLSYAGVVGQLGLDAKECDLVIPVPGGDTLYLEIFCITPTFETQSPGNEPVVHDVKTHTQTAFSSVRQKLLKKIKKQRQMCKPRSNIAVIELNHPMICSDFTVLSSLSDGYKISIDTKTMKARREGYDWSESVFDDPSTCHLKAVEWFFLGDYSSRRFLANPRFTSS